MKLYSNEIVFRGHPDKVCDQISDRLLDEYLKNDKNSRCAIEVCGGKGIIFITGEVTSTSKVNINKIVKEVLKDVGYNEKYRIINNLGIQSSDIALGTNNKINGAGDQGMMFGYATDENDYYLPTAMMILKEVAKSYDKLRQKDERFKSDGKAQITGYYDEFMHLKDIKYFTISYQNTEENRKETDKIIKNMVNEICSKYNVHIEKFLINPTGRFEIGGFLGDSGLTGRKIVVDTYQSFANVGGGAFSGKDPSKVDRSGAYMARVLAKEMLIKHNLKWCTVQLSYAIGLSEPLAIYIDSNLGNIEVEEELYKRCSVENIIKELDLLNTNYYKKAMFGQID